MRIDRFEDLDSWKEARELVKEVYGAFRESRDFGFRDQIQRAAVSVMTNIAEGFGRESRRELSQFLIVARGSAAEVKSLGYVGLDLGYLSGNQFQVLCERCDNVKGLLNGFLRYLRNNPKPK
ncbi:MAG: four helix bundle protein [Deltaproteobacteria bacterium]|nr:four helix bundle protein [Deltaproteobacteria bacterium]